jgi:hypothetical protein
MAKAFQCDNCKEFFPIRLRSISEKPSYAEVNNIAFSILDEHGQRLYRAYDICPSCMRKVQDILSGIGKKVEE